VSTARTGVVGSSGICRKGVEGSVVGRGEGKFTTGAEGSEVA